jgi:hypothetical protein
VNKKTIASVVRSGSGRKGCEFYILGWLGCFLAAWWWLVSGILSGWWRLVFHWIVVTLRGL